MKWKNILSHGLIHKKDWSDPFQKGPLLFTQVSDIHNFLQFFKDGSFSL